MICPHCSQRIEEHETYLMSFRENPELPRSRFATVAYLVLLFVWLAALLALAHS